MSNPTANLQPSSGSGVTTPTAPDSASFFHVGILAPELERAIDWHAEMFGACFLEPIERHLAHFIDDVSGTSGPLTLRYTYSVGEPPYYELLEAHDHGLYSRGGAGLHHVGAWTPDIEAATSRLAQRGVRREAAIQTADGTTAAAYFRPEDLGGTRLELVAESAREFLANWMATGPRRPLP